MDCSFKTFVLLEHADDFIGNLPCNNFSFLLRRIIYQEDVAIFLMQRKGINVNDLFFVNQLLEHSSKRLLI
jgi:hypothetical protein